MRNPVRVILAGTLVGAAFALSAAPAGAATYCVPGAVPAPAALTQKATGVSDTRATLRGSANPNGCPATYHFEYGPTTAYGTATPATSAGTGTRFVSAVAQLKGLTPGSSYHFRIVVTSMGGTVDGADMSFRTPAVPTPPACTRGVSLPSAATRPAFGVTATSADLEGTVGPDGCRTNYFFQYGRTTRYGASTRSHSAGSGRGSVAVSELVGGLTPGAVYHFRLVATNAGGTVFGADATFRAVRQPVARIRIDSRRPSVLRRFFVAIHLHCVSGRSSCGGSVSLFRNGRGLGRRGYAIAPGTSATVFVKLNARGRRLMRGHRQLRHVEVVATSTHNTAVRFVTLVRAFGR